MIRVIHQMGITVHLVSYVPGESFSIRRRLADDGDAMTTITAPRRWPQPLKAFALAIVFLEGLRSVTRCSLIVAHSPSIASGLPGLIVARLARKPFLVDYIDLGDPQTPTRVRDFILKKASVVLAISSFLQRQVLVDLERQAVLLPIFTDVDSFRFDPETRRRVRKDLQIPEKEIVIGYAGSFWSIEGVPVLLEAFQSLERPVDGLCLLLVGGRNVPGADDVQAIVRSRSFPGRVLVLPPQPRSKIPELLSACDVLCAPKIDCEANRAANPVKIVEYLSMGRAVVCSAVGGALELIDHGRDGLLSSPGNASELTQKLHWLILNPATAHQIGARARLKVELSYSYSSAKATLDGILSPFFEEGAALENPAGK
jgi:glycosyltransferase involved in cell wall biosynthesis